MRPCSTLAASSTVIDDFTYYIMQRIFNTNLQCYTESSFYYQLEEQIEPHCMPVSIQFITIIRSVGMFLGRPVYDIAACDDLRSSLMSIKARCNYQQ